MSREMKYSGIPWIGEIPSHWNVMPHKRVMHKVKEIQERYNGENILSLTMKGVIVRDLEAGGKMPTTFDGYQKVYPNNLLQCLFDIDVTPRCVGLIRNEGLTSPAYSQFAMYSNGYAPYFDYLLRYMDDRKTLLHLSKNLRSSLTETDFGAVNTCVPPIIEQQKIAEFLDRKCGEIDEMVALQEQIIEELKAYKQSVITEAVTKGLNPNAPMRDSGIEWVGSIPEHWEVCRIKNIATGFSNGTSVTQLADEDSQYAVTRIETISTGKINYDKVGYVPFFEGINKYLLVKGDILISNINSLERVGNSAMYMGEQTLYHGMNLLRVHTNERMFATYLHYYLRSKAFLEQMKSCCNHAINQVSVSSSTLKNLYIVLPNLTEQQAIADYLDEKCADIDSLIQTKQSKIDSLKEYKKSIIYEYVTGKREVNE